MITGEMIYAVTIGAAMAGVMTTMLKSIIEEYKRIKEEESYVKVVSERIHRNIFRNRYVFYIGSYVVWDDKYFGTVIEMSEDSHLITVLLDDGSIIETTKMQLRKVA